MDNTVGSRQWELIVGTLLGDGFLERDGQHVRLIVEHSEKQLPYVEWKRHELGSLRSSVRRVERFDARTQRRYRSYLLRTRTSNVLESLYELFYDRNRKRIPMTLPKILTPRMLAVWIMDDGYKRNDCNALRLNTQGYSDPEHMIIRQALLAMGIQSNIHRQKQYLVTYIPSRSMNRLRHLVREFIIPEMVYKIA
jgi:hypothetical protein